jgi:sialate O-acetylesterase
MRYLYTRLVSTAAALLLGALPCSTFALSVSSFFSENMVLQRDVSLPVWGKAADGETITVIFGDQKVTTVASGGKWRVNLEPTPAGGPYTLAISGANPNETILLTQVLVGDVWIVSGQSNSILPLHNCDGAEEAIATRNNYPNIRVLAMGSRDMPKVTAPREDAFSFWGACKWENASYLATRWSSGDKPLSQTVPGCVSGLSYFFARELTDYLKGSVPLGILQLGAIVPVQCWVDDETAAATPELATLRGKGYPQGASFAYNDMVAPLAPFPVRGVVYYQGEMNAGKGKGPFYTAGLTAMIESWRKAWNNPDMPFLVVQLSGFIKHLGGKDTRLDMDAATLATFKGENEDHGFCHIRQAQFNVSRSVKGVAQVVTFDVGDPYDIHPRKKLPVAQRLLLQARRLVYGEKDLISESPYPEKVEFANDECRIDLAATGGGLVANGGELKGFELSADGVAFQPATASIKGNSVIVSSAEVKNPTAVRYAWAGWPEANLFNKEGLPATPFRFPDQDVKR